MKFLIILGSPRRNGHTAALIEPFAARLKELNAETDFVALTDLRILPCKGCGHCQNVQDAYGCLLDDDMAFVVDKIRKSDCLVLATPIYSWYCTAEMKALLDRHYGLNKYYGTATGSLWSGKALALITTHGYGDAHANSPLEDGIQRLCKHSSLRYLGRCSARDLGKPEQFLTPEAKADARAFAEHLLEAGAACGQADAEMILEGRRFHDMEGFFREMGRLLDREIPFEPDSGQEQMLSRLQAALGSDPPAYSLTVRWYDFTKSLEDLGPENAGVLIRAMENSMPGGRSVVNTKD